MHKQIFINYLKIQRYFFGVLLKFLGIVENLHVKALSNFRQYRLLSTVIERSMDYTGDDQHIWFQYALALICDNRFLRAIRILNHCFDLKSSSQATNNGNTYNGYPTVNGGDQSMQKIGENGFAQMPPDDGAIVQHMLAARIQLEQLGNVFEGFFYW